MNERLDESKPPSPAEPDAIRRQIPVCATTRPDATASCNVA